MRDRLRALARTGKVRQADIKLIWQQQLLPILRQAARIDFNFFAELVATDDETGKPIRQSVLHKQWAELCEQHPRLLIWSHIESAKTTQLSILRTVWELGKDPSLRFAILSNTKGQAEQILRSIARYIEQNDEVHAIFPDLLPDPAGPWTNTRLRVVRRGNAKDASVRAVGVHGDLTGARVDRLIVDDILDPENCENETGRKKLMAWYKAVAVGRLTARARIVVVGTAYHPKDLLHELSRQKGFVWKRFAVLDEHGRPTWPDKWPLPRIEAKKAELGPAEFARQMLCLARDDGEARFKQVWIDAALVAGDGLDMLPTVDDIEDGSAIFVGVDLAARKKKRSDTTVLSAFLEDRKGRRRILNIKSGKFTGPEIIGIIKDWDKFYHPYAFVVEDNGAQLYLLQFLGEDSNIPVVPFTTGKQKRDPILGVEGMAIELFNGKWVFPNKAGRMDPELEALISEMLFYSPDKHTGDRLISLYFARTKAREIMAFLYGDRDRPAVAVHVVGGDAPSSEKTYHEDDFEEMIG